MREKMRDMDLRVTELSEYLHISRATIYKYIDLYESGKTRGIDDRVKKLFDYIENTPNIGKKNVMSYIMVNLVDSDQSGTVEIVKRYSQSDSCSEEKMIFLRNVCERSDLDGIIPYLNICFGLLSKKDLNEEEYSQLSKLILFRDEVQRNKTVSSVKIKETIRIMMEGKQ